MLKKLIGTTLISIFIIGTISSIVVWNMKNYYTATALLVMTPLPLNVRESTPSIISGSEETPYRVSYLTLSEITTFPMPDYEQIFLSDEIVEEVLLFLSSKEEYKNIQLSRTKLRKQLSIKSKIFFQGTNQIQYQRIIQLQFTSPNPQLSADVCNLWAELGMHKIETLRKQPVMEGLEYLEKQVTEKQSILVELQNKINELNASYHLPSLEFRIQELEKRITEYKLQKISLSVEIDRIEKELEYSYGSTQGEPQKTSIPPSESQFSSNETGQGINEDLTKSKTIKIKERECLQKQIEELEKEIEKLKQTFSTVKMQKEELENQIMIQRRLVNDLTISYQLGKVYMEKSQSELRFASKALTPRQKAGPPRTLYVLCIVVLTAIAVPTIYIATMVLRYYFEKLEKEFTV